MRRALPHVWSVLLPVLLLGPALGAGYVLSYDMVWVPHLALRGDFLGLGTGLPRAVPSDAVVAVLGYVVPQVLLQKLVLLGGLVLLGQGALRLVGASAVARLTAVSLAVWSPFVAERLWMGHWPVLLGTAVLPWLVVLLRRPGIHWALWLLVPLGCLSASAGLVTGLALVVLGAGGTRTARLVGLAVAANAPWVIASVLHLVIATTAPQTQVFGLHGDALPAPLAALGLGGIWNAEVVPHARTTALAWVSLLVLVAGVAAGASTWWRRSPGERGRLVALWVVGYLVALVSWAAPGAVDAVAGVVPGVGLLRDGARYLGLCLPLLVVVVSTGAERVVAAARSLGSAPAVAAGVACVLLPLAVLPDVVWGGHRLDPATYPSSWARARAALAASHGSGDVLVLPFTPYRAPSYNHGHKVLDPLGRYLTRDYVASDELRVGSRTVPGDDPRVPRVQHAVTTDDLTRLGIGYVVQDLTVGSGTPSPFTVTGDRVYADPSIEVVRLPGHVDQRSTSWPAALLVALGWAAYVGSVLVGVVTGVVTGLVHVTRRRRRVVRPFS